MEEIVLLRFAQELTLKSVCVSSFLIRSRLQALKQIKRDSGRRRKRMGYSWKKRLGEELKTEENVRDCGGLERTGSRTAGRWEKET